MRHKQKLDGEGVGVEESERISKLDARGLPRASKVVLVPSNSPECVFVTP